MLEDAVPQLMAIQRELPSAALLDSLNSMKFRPWCVWHDGGPMNQRDFARIFKPHGITSKNIYLAKHHVPKGYEAKDFSPLWQYYLANKNVVVQP